MKTIIRNFLSILRRYKISMLLNVAGLAAAFAVFIVIMMQVDYDRNFDKCHRDADRIFRLEVNFQGEWSNSICRPFGEGLIASSPHIAAGAMADEIDLGSGSADLTYNGPDGRQTWREKIVEVTSGYADVFTFNMVEGNAAALAEPSSILISQTAARRFFGEGEAVGKQLKSVGGDFVVGGVYRDFPRNSSLGNHIYAAFPHDKHKDDWNTWNYSCYIRTDNPQAAENLIADYRRNVSIVDKMEGMPLGEDDLSFRLSPLKSLHYLANVRYDPVPKSDSRTVAILTAIAIVIIAIGGINFSNFGMSLVPKRVRSVNTQKVLGARVASIRKALILESVAIALFSFGVALVIVYLLKGTEAAGLIDAEFSLAAHPGIIAFTALLAVAVGLAAGIYPSWYVTSFPPALALKGNFGLSPKGRALRNLLVGLQFAASFALIISASFIYLQNHFMRNTPLGYDRDQLIVAHINNRIAKQSETFRAKIKQDSSVSEMAFAMNLFGGSDSYNRWGSAYKGESIMNDIFVVSHQFLSIMGIEITEGRNFREEDKGKYIFNSLSKGEYSMELGSTIDGTEIIGFVPDIRFASFRRTVEPMGFYVPDAGWDSGWMSYAYIKIKSGSNLGSAMAHVRSTLKELDSESSFDVVFFDEVMNRLYGQERRLSLLITLFGIVAVLTSMAGVFGLVIFDNEYRRREIGIRKVFGSTTGQILAVFNRTYIRILAVCFPPAALAAWYVINGWLSSFAYRTPMHWWVYLSAFAAVSAITISTVTLQNLRAAGMNPVKSIKSE
ncbi:MAG: ABC transporter permease [Tannerellaceae bacterium]|jgi:putative ABC transport system permease protein|nr:ABC transporter permease [Tannerellaceae bacterium]